MSEKFRVTIITTLKDKAALKKLVEGLPHTKLHMFVTEWCESKPIRDKLSKFWAVADWVENIKKIY